MSPRPRGAHIAISYLLLGAWPASARANCAATHQADLELPQLLQQPLVPQVADLRALPLRPRRPSAVPALAPQTLGQTARHRVALSQLGPSSSRVLRVTGAPNVPARACRRHMSHVRQLDAGAGVALAGGAGAQPYLSRFLRQNSPSAFSGAARGPAPSLAAPAVPLYPVASPATTPVCLGGFPAAVDGRTSAAPPPLRPAPQDRELFGRNTAVCGRPLGPAPPSASSP